MNVKEITEQLRDKYSILYKQWLEEHPGYVMCNYGTKEWILNTVLGDNLNLEGIIYKEKWYRTRHDEGRQHCYIPAEVLKELIELINKENEIITQR